MTRCNAHTPDTRLTHALVDLHNLKQNFGGCQSVVVARADHCHFEPGSRNAAAVLLVPQTAVLG